MPLIVSNFILLGQTMYEKNVTIFLHRLVFWRPRGHPDLKFTSLDPDVGLQQGPLYKNAKFRSVLTTRLRNICCEVSSNSLTA